MPSLQVSIESTSPLINFDRSWSPGASQDAFADQYTLSTFSVTSGNNAVASFTFNGSSVALYGSNRVNHGPYQAQVDSDQSSLVTGNGTSASPLFNQTLYSWSGPQGLHTVTLQNGQASTFIDIDYITFTTNIGEDGEPLITDTYQESHPAFGYNPPASWVPASPAGMFSGGSGIQTADVRAVATFRFIGDGIAVHGPIGTGFSVPYSVTLDGGPSTTFAPGLLIANVSMPREVLYFASNLGKGEHNVTFQLAQSPSAGQVLAIDYAEVFTTPSIGSSYTSAANPPPSQVSGSTSTQQPSSGASHSTVMKLKIALVVTSGIAGIALIALVFVLLTSWRWRRQDTKGRTTEARPDTPSPYRLGLQNPEMATRPLAIPGVTYDPYDPDGLRLGSALPGNRPHHHRGQESMSSGFAMSSSSSEASPLARVGKSRFSFNRGVGGRRQSRAPPAYSPVSPEALS